MILLPYPVGTNRLWRNAKGRTVLSPEALAWKQEAQLRAQDAGIRPIDGPVAVELVLHPRLTTKGKANRTRLDLGASIKPLLDALNGVAYADDKQVTHIRVTLGDPIQDGGLAFTVTEAKQPVYNRTDGVHSGSGGHGGHCGNDGSRVAHSALQAVQAPSSGGFADYDDEPPFDAYQRGGMSDWDRRFLSLAAHVAAWSKDPSTQVGAVIVDDQRRIISTGYNGLPAGVKDRPEWLADRSIKYRVCIHAEKNAIMFAQRDLRGCTIYVHPMPPCAQCAAAIIQSGIRRVVTRLPTPEQRERWGSDWNLAEAMYRDAGLALVEIDDSLEVI